eukprot:COSAG06_NODE_51731_length_310_cov_0.843602_1_plen_70_part_01
MRFGKSVFHQEKTDAGTIILPVRGVSPHRPLRSLLSPTLHVLRLLVRRSCWRALVQLLARVAFFKQKTAY